jgi:phospho-N-acetylmuramoyl-pentapeptide-transferase
VEVALILASLSFLLALGWGQLLIRVLRRYGVGERIRIDGPPGHQVKLGTPTMVGLLIVVPVVLITVALNIFNLMGRTVIGRSILAPLGVMTVYAMLGAADNVAGVREGHRGEGSRAGRRVVLELALACLIALALHFGLGLRSVAIPGVAGKIDLGSSYILVAMLIVMGSSDALKLTDGPDGLMGIIAATCFVAYGVISFLQGQIYLARFCFTVVGACFAFLWHSTHPAQLLVGGTGSLALGTTLGTVALMSGQWLLLPVVALVPVAEALSVIVQAAYFQYSKHRYGQGRRVFKMTPLHHHFELQGWSETQVVQRFWLVQLMAVMAGVALALV